MTVPAFGERYWIAIPSALVTSVKVCAESIDQPALLR
jgi:hypothetical protein